MKKHKFNSGSQIVIEEVALTVAYIIAGVSVCGFFVALLLGMLVEPTP